MTPAYARTVGSVCSIRRRVASVTSTEVKAHTDSTSAATGVLDGDTSTEALKSLEAAVIKVLQAGVTVHLVFGAQSPSGRAAFQLADGLATLVGGLQHEETISPDDLSRLLDRASEEFDQQEADIGLFVDAAHEAIEPREV